MSHSARLEQYLEHALATRKRELTTFRFVLARQSESDEKPLARSGICLLYAHWEGFVVEGARKHLYFLRREVFMLKELSPSYLALALRRKILDHSSSTRQGQVVEIVQAVADAIRSDSVAQFASPQTIGAQSNLDSDRLYELLRCIGLNTGSFDLSRTAVVDRLVGLRNAIAHGEQVPVDRKTYYELHQSAIEAMGLFRDLLLDHADNQRHLTREYPFVDPA